MITVVREDACFVVAGGKAGDPRPGQQHQHEQLRSAWHKITPLLNIVSLLCCNLNTSNLFHCEEGGMTVRKQLKLQCFHLKLPQRALMKNSCFSKLSTLPLRCKDNNTPLARGK